MSADVKHLIDEKLNGSQLARNIRHISESKSKNPPEITLTDEDESLVISACERVVQPELVQLFQSINATENLLKLVSNYITTVNDLTAAIFDQGQLKALDFPQAIIQRLKSKLQLRNEFLKASWPIDVTDSNGLVDSICNEYQSVSSFQSLPYNSLDSKHLTKATGFQKKILENIWMDGNDLRKKVKEHQLPLSLTDSLERQGVHQLTDLTEDEIKVIIETNEKEMKEKQKETEINTTKREEIFDEHERFKASLNRMFKKEVRRGKQEAVQNEQESKEQKERQEKAMKAVEDIKKNLDKSAGDYKQQLEKELKDVGLKLQQNWQFTEEQLGKPDALLNSILDKLNNDSKQFDSNAIKVYAADEDIIANISSGIVLYGIKLTDPQQLGEIAQRPLLSRPHSCSLKGPLLLFESTQEKFTSLQASNQFVQTIKTSGLTVAAEIQASGWGFSAKASHGQGSQNSSTSSDQKKSQSTAAVMIDYTIVPIKCFRIPREEMALSKEAENELATVNSPLKAKEFLGQFHSHVSDGIQHIGGVFMRIVTVETKEETDVKVLEREAAKHMDNSASVGGSFNEFGFGTGVSVKSFDITADKEGTETIKREATITRKVQCIGPPCYSQDLFITALRSNNSSWYVIDRDALKSFIPIWEIIQTRYSSQPEMLKAASLLRDEWLSQAQDYKRIPFIKKEIDRVKYHELIHSDGTRLKPPGVLSNQQIKLIKEDNSSLSEETIQARYKEFIKRHPSGQVNEDEFVLEFEQLYKKERIENYSRYIFRGIDRDTDNALDFNEFMTAVAITPGVNVTDRKTRLHLIYDYLDSENENGVKAKNFVEYIERITEMVSGSKAVNKKDIHQTVKYMFQNCGKSADKEKLSKEEFLNFCKKDQVSSDTFLLEMEDERKMQKGVVVAGNNGVGDGQNQLSSPMGLYVDDDQTIYIADNQNNRITKWRYKTSSGHIVVGEGGANGDMSQLQKPADVIFNETKNCLTICDRKNRRVVQCTIPYKNNMKTIMEDIDCHGIAMCGEYLYVSDYRKDEVRRWTDGTDSVIVAGGNGKGSALNQLDYPIGVFVDDDESVYVSDKNNHRVMKWEKNAKEGVVVAGNEGEGNSLKQLSSPHGVVVDKSGTVYVADRKNHRIMRWSKRAVEGSIFADERYSTSKLNEPTGLSLDSHDYLYVVDAGNARVLRFDV